MYGLAAEEIIMRLENGEYEDYPPNELLKLRQRLFQRQRELQKVGVRHGFFLKTAKWFDR
jgi:hypothetical protein